MIERTHTRIVERCIGILTSSAEHLSKEVGPNVLNSDVAIKYFRTLELLDPFVKGFRTRPFYSSGEQDNTVLKGEPIRMTIRISGAGITPQPHAVQLGSLNTAYDLQALIYRFIPTKHRVVVAGREIKLAEEPPMKTLKDLNIRDNSPIQIYAGTQGTAPATKIGTGPVQPDVSLHFQDLYKLLDLPEQFSINAWLFLKNFPPNESVKQLLLNPDTPSIDILPPEKPFKCLYSLFALNRCFEEQKSTQDDLMPFLCLCVSRLGEALAGSIERSGQEVETRVAVTTTLLEQLHLILGEPIVEASCLEIHPQLDGFVDCLFGILHACTCAPYSSFPGVEACITNAIHVVYESCRINPEIWRQASKLPSFEEIVGRFLVNDPRPAVRESVSDEIISMCTFSGR